MNKKQQFLKNGMLSPFSDAGIMNNVDSSSPTIGDFLLQENGDCLLLETGDKILLEQ